MYRNQERRDEIKKKKFHKKDEKGRERRIETWL